MSASAMVMSGGPEDSQNGIGVEPDSGSETAERKQGGSKKLVLFLLKLAIAAGAYFLIFRKIVAREGIENLGEQLATLRWEWIGLAIASQLTAITFAVFRWRALLHGQGIKPSPGFLAGSIMIARFWGAFTPGGFTGFGGWRIFDVAQHTGKTSRATATIGVETLLGQVAFGLVVMGASIFGKRFLGDDGVLLVNLFFGGVVATALVLLAKPTLFRWAADTFLPGAIRTRVQSLVDAVCAYEGKGKLLGFAVLMGLGVHAFNNLIYVSAARALDVELSVGMVFFASSLQIFATLIPASINGMGLRETAAVALYTSPAVGLATSTAVLIPIVGFACEMFVSAWGGLIFLLRGSEYAPAIQVEDAEHEQLVAAKVETVAPSRWPVPTRALKLGLSAGVFAGMLVGVGEGIAVILGSSGPVNWGVMSYGALAYGLFVGLGGAVMLYVLAWSGRLMKRPAFAPSFAFGNTVGLFVGVFGFALGAFRIRRDVFHEELVWKSLPGLGVLLGTLAVAALVGGLLALGLRAFTRSRAGSALTRVYGGPLVLAVTAGTLYALIAGFGPVQGTSFASSAAAPNVDAGQGNVLFIVVDTLRADHLPAYGYENGSTPNLDAFAQDAIRYDQAFANASWTRPSFASILSGRYPASHSVMAKSDALPSSLTTMPEAFQSAGWHTRGLATNFNVGPYFNFHQGFDDYQYLEPEFVLGADDAAAKLLLMQVVRRVMEKVDEVRGRVVPGRAYQDAPTVNAEVVSWLEEAPADRPFFFFVGYMDPHDPYFPHPYDGTGYSRAANQQPDPSEADTLRELYDGEITFWDEHFGQLVDELKRRGVYDDLTIVVTADHGEEFCEHGGFWHGTTLYDEQVRVPLLVKLPANRNGGTVVRHWVQSIDLMPSLLRMNDIAIPEGVQGGDITEGTTRVFSEESHEGNILQALRERRGTDEHKIITANQGNPRGLEPVEYYRVDFDASEENDLAAEERYAEVLGSLQESLVSTADAASVGAAEAESRELTSEEIRRLCELGYMTGARCTEVGATTGE